MTTIRRTDNECLKPVLRPSEPTRRPYTICSLFAICSHRSEGAGPFPSYWLLLKIWLAPFIFARGDTGERIGMILLLCGVVREASTPESARRNESDPTRFYVRPGPAAWTTKA